MINISVRRIFLDCLAIGVLALLVLIFKSVLKPPWRGFYCDDQRIRYPYMAPTISWTTLGLITLIAPILLISAIEAVEVMLMENKRHLRKHYVLRAVPVHRYAVRLYILIGHFLLGLCLNVLFSDVAKFSTGTLRPNFIAACLPDKDEVNHARLSFYSAHATFSFYAAVFLFFYLHGRLHAESFTRTVLPVVKCLILLIAFYISLSSISDYTHHAEDILCGILIGSGLGYIVIMQLASNFGEVCDFPMGLMNWYDSQAQPSSNLSAMDVRKMTPADRERIRHTYANQHPSGLPVNPSVLGCEMSVLDGADNMGYSGTMGTTRSASAVGLNHQTARTTSSSPRTSAASNFLQNFKRSVLVY